MNIIKNIDNIKNLSDTQLDELCGDIRGFLINSISKTGGHLSSNLGIVELTVSLHKIFNTEKDRIVFDVGHQAYVHKILTGRAENFDTLRTFGGISPFTRPSESTHDAFIAGHASNSVSLALGMAHSRSILNQDYNVIAVIGDGALTGGLAYEALNNAGSSGEPLIVILNDNNMSIAENVGAMPRHLANLRLRPPYIRIKKGLKETLKKIPFGKGALNLLTKTKNGFKSVVLPSSLFEKMGFTYLGPVDGHDIKSLSEIIGLARELNKPVIIHTLTTKGKGYSYAEKAPDKYHGVTKFNVETGAFLKKKTKDFSAVFGEKMLEIASKDNRICAITAAMPSGTGLVEFAQNFRNRFFDVGIAEAHAASMAAGMAKQGLIPVFAVYSTFLQRAFDQLIHDIAILNLHVVIALDRAGIVGEDGETHNGVFDVSYIRTIPGFTLLAPSNFSELSSFLDKAVYDYTSPVAIRYPRGSEGVFLEDTTMHDFIKLIDGKDVTIVTYGIMLNEVLKATEQLKDKSVLPEIIKINNLSSDFTDIVLESISKTKRLIVVEDVVYKGSVAEQLANLDVKYFKAINTGDRFLTHGSLEDILNYACISAEHIIDAITEGINL